MGLHIRYHHRYSSTPLPTQAQPNFIHPIGPYGANVFDPRSWGNRSDPEEINFITLEFTRVVLAIGVFAIGVELPKAYMMKHWKSLFFLLVPVMTWVRIIINFFFILGLEDLIHRSFSFFRLGSFARDSYTLSSLVSISSPA